MDAQLAKVDEGLGLVFGWALICKQDGREYFDEQGDHVGESVMLKAAADFMQNSRVAGDMHNGPAGTVVFCWPASEDVMKSLGIETKTTGLLVAMKPDDPAMLEKFRTGEYTGFSIGGTGRRRSVTE